MLKGEYNNCIDVRKKCFFAVRITRDNFPFEIIAYREVLEQDEHSLELYLSGQGKKICQTIEEVEYCQFSTYYHCPEPELQVLAADAPAQTK